MELRTAASGSAGGSVPSGTVTIHVSPSKDTLASGSQNHGNSVASMAVAPSSPKGMRFSSLAAGSPKAAAITDIASSKNAVQSIIRSRSLELPRRFRNCSLCWMGIVVVATTIFITLLATGKIKL